MRETHIKVTSDVTIGLITDLLEKHYEELGYSITNIEDVKHKFVDAILNKPRSNPAGSTRSSGQGRDRSPGAGRYAGAGRPPGSSRNSRGDGRVSRPASGGRLNNPSQAALESMRDGRGSDRPPAGARGSDRPPTMGGSFGKNERDNEGQVRDFIGDNVFLTVELSDVVKTHTEYDFDKPVELTAEQLIDSKEDCDVVSIFEEVANDLDTTTEEIANEFEENVGLSDGGKI